MKPAASKKKLRGGYYTPEPITQFLAKWAIQSSKDTILEPSCGDGNFILPVIAALRDCGATTSNAISQVVGIEVDDEEATKAARRIAQSFPDAQISPIVAGDFFSLARQRLQKGISYDIVLGNPPFIRYQNFPEDYRNVALEMMEEVGLKPSRLTNAWLPFVVASTRLLSENGRLGMVIPAELLQVKYAAELRLFLSEQFERINLITFKKLVFKEVQQEVVLLLAEKYTGSDSGIKTIEVNDLDDLITIGSSALHNGKNEIKKMDHSTEKWTLYFLDNDELKLLRKLKTHPKLTKAEEIIDVDVGIVTGRNKFFVLTDEEKTKRSLTDYSLPLVGRSANLQGLFFSEGDWKETVKEGSGAFLFYPPDLPLDKLSQCSKEYIEYGQQEKLHTGYKCRIRKRWYIVPSVYVTEGFMLRQIHKYPKIVVNDSGAVCTDTIHRVKLRNGASMPYVAAAFLNSLTFAFSEVLGRSYGGGVLELEPNEAEELPIPLHLSKSLDLQLIDSLLRQNDIDKILDMNDKILLVKGLGLTNKEVKMLRSIWKKMSARRINRKYERRKKQ